MSIEVLSQALSKLAPDQPCLLHGNKAYTAGQLLDKADYIQNKFNIKSGQRIALCGLSPFELVIALIAFDGKVEAMILLPPSLNEATCEMLMLNARCTHRLNSCGEELETLRNESILSVKGVIQTQWILATSGTTGVPKLIEHNLGILTRTVKRSANRGAEYVWGLLYDPCRFAGLQVVLQALLSGAQLVITDESTFQQQLDALKSHPVNALSATPSLWRKLLMDGSIASLRLRQITLGGETADQPTINVLKSTFPNARVIHIYASTEAGVGFAVQDGFAGFPANWLESPLFQPQLRVNSENHLLIKPAAIPKGKEIDSRLDCDGYLDTEDLVRIENNRVLFLGRATGAINVGGNKVRPEEIEAFLRGIEGVHDAFVYGKQNSILGQLVAAKVVPSINNQNKDLKQKILEQCRAQLEPWQVPAILTFTVELQETAAGKRERATI